MHYCRDMPVPFWSRASNEKAGIIVLPDDIADAERVQLLIKIWDGGEGTVNNPFTINGHPYPITSGRAVHDVVFTRVDVAVGHLKPGENTVTLLSDTSHHGIEILLPGPCLLIRSK